MEISTMTINWREYKYYIICLIIGVIIGGCIGFNIGRYYYPRVETVVETKLTPGKEIVTEKTHTDIQYVPKTRYVDTKGNTVQEDTDVELNDTPEQVTVKVNGKETKFNTLSNETQKFENGKFKNKDIITKHPNIVFGLIKGKKSWGLHVKMWSEGISEGTFRKVEIFDDFEKENVKIPESFYKEFMDSIFRHTMKKK